MQSNIVCFSLPVESSYKQQQGDDLNSESNVITPPKPCNDHTYTVLIN